MRWTFLSLVTKGNLKICFVGTLHKQSDITPLTKQYIAHTYITWRIRRVFTFRSTRRSDVYTWYNKTFCKSNNSRKNIAQQYKSRLIHKCKKYGRFKTVVGLTLAIESRLANNVVYTHSSANTRGLLQSHAFWPLSNLVVLYDSTQSVYLPGTSNSVPPGPYKQTILTLWFDFFDCISSTSCCDRLHMLRYSEMSDLCSHQLHPSLIVLKVPQLQNLPIWNGDES